MTSSSAQASPNNLESQLYPSIEKAIDDAAKKEKFVLYFQLLIQQRTYQLLEKKDAGALRADALEEIIKKEVGTQTRLIQNFMKKIFKDYEKESIRNNISFELFLDDAALDYSITCMQDKMALHEGIIDAKTGELLQTIRESFRKVCNVYKAVQDHKEKYGHVYKRKSRPPKEKAAVRNKNKSNEPAISLSKLHKIIMEEGNDRGNNDPSLGIRQFPLTFKDRRVRRVSP